MKIGSATLFALLAIGAVEAEAQVALACSYQMGTAYSFKGIKVEKFTLIFDEATQTISIDGAAPQPAKINAAAIEFPSNRKGYTVLISRVSGAVAIGTQQNPRAMQGSCKRSAQKF
ncbi:hypothetical protein DSM104443_00939 [Usitatibacter rugosus]|uniref:Uncharacterized protein n=1 Tax=Usitatibacter rugosus TaxID=2732067 RepID=A0A6M4GRC7_9PROT|nr:hypothetical protein [Usitatibacter rugosus]QJR09889.1 hypothetical protein DSM104443_00939 [Usitatibacter rugosus]